jgi:hypothetical protein
LDQKITAQTSFYKFALEILIIRIRQSDEARIPEPSVTVAARPAVAPHKSILETLYNFCALV